MFARIAGLVARHAKLVVLLWFALAGTLMATAPRFEDVATQDTSAFLGNQAPSVEGAVRIYELWPDDEFSQSAAVIAAREGGLTKADRGYLRETEAWLNSDAAPENVRLTQSVWSRPEFRDVLTSEDGEAMLMVVGFTTPPFEPATNEAVRTIREHLHESAPEGLVTYLTGNAGVGADQNHAIKTAVDRTTIITLFLVVAILVWIYRSPVAPLIPLTTVGVAFGVSLGVISFLAQAGLKVSALVQTFMVVIVLGAGTDYCLFIVSRFKEELAGGGEARRTLIGTMTIIGGVIASSAATVIVGFGTQGVAKFGMFRTMGPAMAIAVAITLVAGLTLTPALLRILGVRAFWPQKVGVRVPGGEEVMEPPAVEAEADEAGPSARRPERRKRGRRTSPARESV
jgi:RND superfamily putative drug exporter